jgi:hypothetical protein
MFGVHAPGTHPGRRRERKAVTIMTNLPVI